MKHRAFFTALMFCVLIGCQRGLDAPANQAEGEKALHTALTAWKDGKSQADLEKGSPSILMNEDDWRTGKRLLEFTMEEGALSGRQVRWQVRLQLQDKEGKTMNRAAVYIIDTTPRIVIVRDLFASAG